MVKPLANILEGLWVVNEKAKPNTSHVAASPENKREDNINFDLYKR